VEEEANEETQAQEKEDEAEGKVVNIM